MQDFETCMGSFRLGRLAREKKGVTRHDLCQHNSCLLTAVWARLMFVGFSIECLVPYGRDKLAEMDDFDLGG